MQRRRIASPHTQGRHELSDRWVTGNRDDRDLLGGVISLKTTAQVERRRIPVRHVHEDDVGPNLASDGKAIRLVAMVGDLISGFDELSDRQGSTGSAVGTEE